MAPRELKKLSRNAATVQRIIRNRNKALQHQGAGLCRAFNFSRNLSCYFRAFSRTPAFAVERIQRFSEDRGDS